MRLSWKVLLPGLFRIAKMNKDTSGILRDGWSPVLSAMMISSLGGTILNRVITQFPNIALFQPVINGVAGNLGTRSFLSINFRHFA